MTRSSRLGAAGALVAALFVFSVARLAHSFEELELRLAESNRPDGGSWSWGYRSPRVRDLEQLLADVRGRIPARSVVEVAPAEGAGDPHFVFLWCQFLAPELDLRLARDAPNEPRPRYRLVLGESSAPPNGAAPIAQGAAGWLVEAP